MAPGGLSACMGHLEEVRGRWNEALQQTRAHQLVEWQDLRMRQLQDVLGVLERGADVEGLSTLREAHREEAELVREQHTAHAATLLDDKAAEVAAAEEASPVDRRLLVILDTADAHKLAAAALDALRQQQQDALARLATQNAQLKAELLASLRPYPAFAPSLQTLEEYSQVSVLLEAHCKQLENLRRALIKAERTREARVAGVVEECCDHIDDFRGRCRSLRLTLQEDGRHGALRGILEGHKAAADAAGGDLQAARLELHVQQWGGRRRATTMDLKDFQQSLEKELDLLRSQRQILEDLRSLPKPGRGPPLAVVQRCVGDAVRQMAHQWSAAVQMKEAIMPLLARQPILQPLLKPLLQQTKFPGQAAVTKHIQQLKAVVSLLDAQDDDTDEEVESLIDSQRADCAALKEQEDLLRSLSDPSENPESDAGHAAALGEMFARELALTARWAATARRLCGGEPERPPITEPLLYETWEEHEQEASEIQLAVQVILKDLLPANTAPAAPAVSAAHPIPAPTAVPTYNTTDPAAEPTSDPVPAATTAATNVALDPIPGPVPDPSPPPPAHFPDPDDGLADASPDPDDDDEEAPGSAPDP